MKVVTTKDEIKSHIRQAKKERKKIGFVPTMGYLHQGHLSLMKQARSENDLVVASIYVNPTQFGVNEDLDAYPRDLDKDTRLSAEVGVDLLFTPDNRDMYPDGYATFVNIEGPLTSKLCGRSRSGHFKGVTTIVSKLFGIVEPDRAYFGQKDAQQLTVIRKMVTDLNMNVDIIGCPIVREKDGLAMSSRNTYLSSEERKEALVLSRSLIEAENLIKRGERNVETVKQFIKDKIMTSAIANIDYVEIVQRDNLEDITSISGTILIALAVKFGSTRLIDNTSMEI